VTPYQGFPTETFVEIPHGTGTAGIARELAKDGVIRYSWELELLHLVRPSTKLQAGEYRFAKAASAIINAVAMPNLMMLFVTGQKPEA